MLKWLCNSIKTVENITKRAKGSFLEGLANGISGLFEMGTKNLIPEINLY